MTSYRYCHFQLWKFHPLPASHRKIHVPPDMFLTHMWFILCVCPPKHFLPLSSTHKIDTDTKKKKTICEIRFPLGRSCCCCCCYCCCCCFCLARAIDVVTWLPRVQHAPGPLGHPRHSPNLKMCDIICADFNVVAAFWGCCICCCCCCSLTHSISQSESKTPASSMNRPNEWTPPLAFV